MSQLVFILSKEAYKKYGYRALFTCIIINLVMLIIDWFDASVIHQFKFDNGEFYLNFTQVGLNIAESIVFTLLLFISQVVYDMYLNNKEVSNES